MAEATGGTGITAGAASGITTEAAGDITAGTAGGITTDPVAAAGGVRGIGASPSVVEPEQGWLYSEQGQLRCEPSAQPWQLV